jgi:hypothetical protein
MSNETANAIFDVLVSEAGASEGYRESFVHNQTHSHVTEWRFMGNTANERLKFGARRRYRSCRAGAG